MPEPEAPQISTISSEEIGASNLRSRLHKMVKLTKVVKGQDVCLLFNASLKVFDAIQLLCKHLVCIAWFETFNSSSLRIDLVDGVLSDVVVSEVALEKLLWGSQ